MIISNNMIICKSSKQILCIIYILKHTWSVDSLAKKVVGEKQTVTLVVQFVVTILNMITEIAHEQAYNKGRTH